MRREESKKALRKTANNVNEYKIFVTGCTSRVCKVTAHPGVQAAHVNILGNSRLAEYPMNKVRVAMHIIPPNVSSKRVTLISDEEIPKIITLMLVRHEAYKGSYDMGPHIFPNYTLEYLELLINGQFAGHTRRIEMNYEDHYYAQAYTMTMCSLGRMFGDRSCAISYEDFAQGNAIYCFDIASGLTGKKDAELMRNGTVTVELTFATPLAHTVNIAYCGEFDEQMTVDLH